MSLRVVAGFLLVATVLYLLHRVALWMEGRGWLYYRTRKAPRASVGNALLELQSLLEPDRGHTVEVRRQEQLEEDESGDPPSTAGGDDGPRGAGPE